MGTLTLQSVRDATYKLLNEYQTVTANVDTNIVNRVDEQINLCYMELATKDKVSASFWISQFPIYNLLYPSTNNQTDYYGNGGIAYGGGDMFVAESYLNTALNYSTVSAKSYYFEVDNNCKVDVFEVSTTGVTSTLTTLTITGISIFTQYVGFITALTSGDEVGLSFYTSGGGTFDVRNVALYAYSFSGVTASIPYYQPYVEYAVPSSFYAMNRMRFRYYNDYRTFTDYRIENDVNNLWRVLISRQYRGEFVFDYWKMPDLLTTATNSFSIRDAYALIIPWGAAGAILLGNGYNANIGTTYMQIYEQKKNAIKTDHPYGLQKLDNTQRW